MTAPSTVSTHTDRAHLRLGLGRALLRLAYICLSSLRNEALSDHFRLTARRVLVALLLLLLLMLSALWNHLGFMLDDLLVPAWRLTEVTAPLVIVGNARSGTSTLHRLVCLDARLSSLRTWEILFGLSVTFHRLVCAAYDLDQRLGGRVTSLIAALERATWGRCSLHPLGLCEFEEDEWLFLTQGLSQLLLLPFPLATDALAPLIYFDELPEESRMCLFAFYRTCVQRHLYARTLRLGFAPRFVCKNPTFTLRLGSLLQAFPDALVMCAVRSPVQSVPSMVSYIGAAWHLFAAPVDAHPNVHQLLEFCFAHYLYPLEMLRSGRLPAAQLAFVSYEALVLDHRAVVMDALARLGVPTHPDTEAALQGAARKAGERLLPVCHPPHACRGVPVEPRVLAEGHVRDQRRGAAAALRRGVRRAPAAQGGGGPRA